MTVPLTVLIGKSLKAVIVLGEPFKFTVYSNVPIFWVPTRVAPATAANCGRMKLVAWSNSVVSDRLSLDRASCRIGTLEALKLKISGGVMPAGICFNTVCDIAATWARAALMFTVGWKKILMIP